MIARPGYTLIELAYVLLLGTFLLALAAPAFTHGRDALAVRAARDQLAHTIALARATAPLHGGADVLLEPAAARITLRTGSRVREQLALGTRYRVSLRVENSEQPQVLLHFDALGIGRLANRTISLRRGTARAGVTLSMYGRSRSW